ncbi:TetR/AcrR family transcriptional regulator [Mariprofundus ferrooxydans]|nr:TetR/AcrR family transcriptional regulator [Mariprofundus ferrooxydans]
MKREQIDTRQHILNCGQLLIAEKGFAGVGLSQILSDAKVPKGSFYHYFASKELFGIDLLESYFTHYLERLDTLFEHTGKAGAERLINYFDLWIETQSGNDLQSKCLIVKLAAEVSDLSVAMRTTMMHGTDAILLRLTRCISDGQADGSISNKQAAEKLALLLYQTWLGATLLAKLRHNESTLQAAMNETHRLLNPKQ